MGSKALKKSMNECLEILLPELSKFYDINLSRPNIDTMNNRNCIASGYFSNIGKNGLIKINEDKCNNKSECARIMSHELGHAALYQNCESFNYILRLNAIYCLSEGISHDFEKEGITILRKNGYLSLREASREHFKTDLNTIGSILLPNYFIGYSVKNRLKKQGVSIKEMITNPLDYREDIENTLLFKIFNR